MALHRIWLAISKRFEVASAGSACDFLSTVSPFTYNARLDLEKSRSSQGSGLTGIREMIKDLLSSVVGIYIVLLVMRLIAWTVLERFFTAHRFNPRAVIVSDVA